VPLVDDEVQPDTDLLIVEQPETLAVGDSDEVSVNQEAEALAVAVGQLEEECEEVGQRDIVGEFVCEIDVVWVSDIVTDNV
jgi:hypothetical protein